MEPMTIVVMIVVLLIGLTWATIRMTGPEGASQQAFTWFEDSYWKMVSGEEGRDENRHFGPRE